jgi:hypothetical protein
MYPIKTLHFLIVPVVIVFRLSGEAWTLATSETADGN